MPFSPRDRILSVYERRTPDTVPFMLDLSHWFLHRNHIPWDLSRSYTEPERDLIDYHRRNGVGFYMAALPSFYSTAYGADVTSEVRRETRDGETTILWRLTTPLGAVERRRVWEESSYSWAIRDWGVRSEQDLRVLGYALGSRTFEPAWERFDAYAAAVGDAGVVYMPLGYSGMGHCLCLWMGVEGVVAAIQDWPRALHRAVDEINQSNLELVDLLAASPAEIIVMGDNFSSDLQPPHFFREWSRPFYAEAIRRLHEAGKQVAVHVDGRLRGLLRAFSEMEVDCIDATTPAPMGDLTPAQCRLEAGPAMILSGGVPPTLWLPEAPEAEFRQSVTAWLDLRKRSSALLAGAGDQVPPGAAEERIFLMRDLVARQGRY